MYTNCPSCNQRASEKTIQQCGECNDCQSNRRLNYYFEEDYRLVKINSKYASDLLLEFIIFIKKSTFKNVLLSRMVIDFIKLLNGFDGNEQLSETELEKNYYSKSSIKSPTIIFAIKAYLFSKKLLILDKDITSISFYPEDIRPEKRFRSDVLEYFFSKDRCHDCGNFLSEKSKHNYCYDCIGYRGVSNRTTYEYLKVFNNNSIRGLYINFIQYLYGLNRRIQTYATILENVEKYFIFIQEVIPDGLNVYPFVVVEQTKDHKFKVITRDKYFSLFLSEEWFSKFENKFSGTTNSVEVFLTFLEEMGLFKRKSKNEKELIVQKVEKINVVFRKPILKMIEFEETNIENLKHKNASKSKKWVSVESNIHVILHFYNWISERYSLLSWAEIEEDMVNKYLLNFDFMNGQIKKRTLFNFFAYMKKHGFIFSVPIEQFVARDSMIEIKPLSLKQHKAIFKVIESGGEDIVEERLLASLAYFHGLTSGQIRSIHLKDIRLDRQCIEIENRPPAFLSKADLILLKKVLEIRAEKLGRKHSEILFPSFKSLKDTPSSNNVISRKVKSITGYSPKQLRIAAFQYCAAEYGAEYLKDSFGLSLTQSARYARVGEDLLNLQVKEELDKEFNKSNIEG